MRTKCVRALAYLPISVILFFAFVYAVYALPVTTISFHGVDVTIEITFPEEAHPTESITHNVTITSNTAVTLRNFTVVIEASVNSSRQEIFYAQDTFSKPLPTSYSLPILLPQETNVTLQCFIYVNTTQSADYLFCEFYSTHVRTLSFNELLSEYNTISSKYTTLIANYQTLTNQYNELLADHTSLLADYRTLLNEHDELSLNYSRLITDYGALQSENNELFANSSTLMSDFETLVSQHNQLLTDYNDRVAAYDSLLRSNENLTNEHNTLNSNYNLLLDDYNTLQTDYDLLNSTRHNLQAEYNSLQNVYNALNSTYTNLQTEVVDLQERIGFFENALDINRILLFIFAISTGVLVLVIFYVKRRWRARIYRFLKSIAAKLDFFKFQISKDSRILDCGFSNIMSSRNLIILISNHN